VSATPTMPAVTSTPTPVASTPTPVTSSQPSSAPPTGQPHHW
jgi:hypothetical protein